MHAEALQPTRLVPAVLVAAAAAAVGLLAGIDPAFAILASLGVAAALVTFADLAAGIVLLFLVAFLEQAPLAGPTLSFTKLAGAMVALAWVARMATDREAASRFLPASHPIGAYLLVAFVGWTAISIGWAEVRSEAVSELLRYALVALLYVIVFTAVKRERDAAWIVGGFVLGAAVTAAYGLIVRPAGVEAAQGGVRLVSTVDDPNVLAASLVSGLVLATALMLGWRGSGLARLGAGVAVVLALAAFLLTGSRGGLIAAAGAAVAAVALGGRWRPGIAALAAVLAASVFVYYAALAPPEQRDRLLTATAGEQQQSLMVRPTIWEVGWRMVEDNPVRGVGVGNFEENSIRYLLEPGSTPRTDVIVDQATVAHNTYLQVLAETGVVGLGLFLSIIGFSLGSMVVAARRFRDAGNLRMEMLSRALVVASIGFLVAAFFISEQVSKQLWLLLALGPGVLSLAIRRPTGAAGGAGGGGSDRRRSSAADQL